MYEIAVSVSACLRSNTRADIAWMISPNPTSLATDALLVTPGGGRIGVLLGKTFDGQLAEVATRQLPTGRIIELGVSEFESITSGLPAHSKPRFIILPAHQISAQMWPALLERERIALVAHIEDGEVVETSLFTAATISLGANFFLAYKSKLETLMMLENLFNKTEKPNVAIETSGQVESIEICYESTADNSHIILVGVPTVGRKVTLYTLPLHLGKTLSGSKGGSSKPEEDIPKILSMYSSGLLNSDHFPTQVYPFRDINEAIMDLRKGVPYRPILSISQ